MKQRLKLLLVVFFLGIQTTGFCVEEKYSGRRVFVVETDAQSAAESIDRVSGKIDLGFSTPDQTFDSPDQYAPGPFARQQQAEKNKAS